jgi:hypothetical protein
MITQRDSLNRSTAVNIFTLLYSRSRKGACTFEAMPQVPSRPCGSVPASYPHTNTRITQLRIETAKLSTNKYTLSLCILVCVCSTGEEYPEDERAAVETHEGGDER